MDPDENSQNQSAQLQFLDSGNISKGKIVAVTSGVADTEFALTHNLGYRATGYIVIGQDKAGVTYDSVGGTENTDNILYLKNSVATVALRVWVF